MNPWVIVSPRMNFMMSNPKNGWDTPKQNDKRWMHIHTPSTLFGLDNIISACFLRSELNLVIEIDYRANISNTNTYNQPALQLIIQWLDRMGMKSATQFHSTIHAYIYTDTHSVTTHTHTYIYTATQFHSTCIHIQTHTFWTGLRTTETAAIPLARVSYYRSSPCHPAGWNPSQSSTHGEQCESCTPPYMFGTRKK